MLSTLTIRGKSGSNSCGTLVPAGLIQGTPSALVTVLHCKPVALDNGDSDDDRTGTENLSKKIGY